MLDQWWRRVGYANVMSTIAVFGVLAGGGAYAAAKIGPNDIAKHAVRSKHIKAGNVKSSDIASGLRPRFASVSDDGELENGRGVVSATRTGEGDYSVVFDRDVRKCAPVVTKGVYGSGTISNAAVARADLPSDAGPTDTVEVIFSEPVAPFSRHDTDFHLALACR